MRTSLKINPVVRDETCHILSGFGFTDDQAARLYAFRSKTATEASQKPSIVFAKGEDNWPEIAIYEQIGLDWWTGDGMTAKRFRDELAALGDISALRVRLNSPGGDAFDGFTIYNLLREHPALVEMRVDGNAASAASIIAMSGDEVVMAPASSMMIHRAMTIGAGNRNDFAKILELLDMVDGQISDTYARKSGRKSETFLKMMDAETWLTAEDAVKERLADRIDEPKDTKAKAACPEPVAAIVPDEVVVTATRPADCEEKLARLTPDHIADQDRDAVITTFVANLRKAEEAYSRAFDKAVS